MFPASLSRLLPALLPLVALACQSPQKDSALPHTITVTATSVGEVDPDVALLQISLKSVAGPNPISIEQVEHRLLEGMKAAGIPLTDLHSDGTSAEPLYESNSKGPQPPLLRSYSIRVHKPIQISIITNALPQKALDNIRTVDFTLANPDAAIEKLRAKAMKQARARAENLAEAVGQHIGKAIQVNDGTYVRGDSDIKFDAPRFVAIADTNASANERPISVGFQKVSLSATVNVIFALRVGNQHQFPYAPLAVWHTLCQPQP